MKKTGCLYLLLTLFVAYSGAQNKTFISTKGTNIIGTDGKPFYIKGTNLGNWLVPEGYMFKFNNAPSPRLIEGMLNELIGPDSANEFWQKYAANYITRDDIHYLKTIGMNSIRIPFHYKLFTNEAYMGGQGIAHGFAIMDKVINWCRQENLFVILDMHCAPGGQTGDNIDDSWGSPFLFESRQYRQQTVNTWKLIANHYRNEPTVMGYDLLNEPIATYFDSSRYNKYLEPLYKKITAAIRSVDANHLIIYGGAQWDVNFKIFGPPFDRKAVYTFHKYGGQKTVAALQEYIDFGNKYQVPIYCGETGENTDEWVAEFTTLLNQQKIGWHYWPYKKMNNTKGIVSFAMPEQYKEVIRFADTARNNFDLIRKAKPTDETRIREALDGFLNNCLFKNCLPNKGYISALGLGK